jgi:hypothetical protein
MSTVSIITVPNFAIAVVVTASLATTTTSLDRRTRHYRKGCDRVCIVNLVVAATESDGFFLLLLLFVFVTSTDAVAAITLDGAVVVGASAFGCG